MNPVIFNNNVLRDGHQSLAATRMSTGQMLPVCEDLDEIGFEDGVEAGHDGRVWHKAN